MDVATIKGATHNPGAPLGWTEANGPCGTLPIIYRKDSHGNPECVSAWKPSESDLKNLNDGGFVILSRHRLASSGLCLHRGQRSRYLIAGFRNRVSYP